MARNSKDCGGFIPVDSLDVAARATRRDRRGRLGHPLLHTRSRPFHPPSTGKSAVKVINHYETRCSMCARRDDAAELVSEQPALHPHGGGGLHHHSIRGGQHLDTGRAHDAQV